MPRLIITITLFIVLLCVHVHMIEFHHKMEKKAGGNAQQPDPSLAKRMAWVRQYYYVNILRHFGLFNKKIFGALDSTLGPRPSYE